MPFRDFQGIIFCDTSSRAMNQEGKLIYGGLLLHEPLLPGYVSVHFAQEILGCEQPNWAWNHANNED